MAMSDFSPEAQSLMVLWNCMSLNMRSALVRARYLEQKAAEKGKEAYLRSKFREYRVRELYNMIGKEMRALSQADGVERSMPPDPVGEGRFGFGRFVDFRISEKAFPEMELRMGRLNKLVLNLTVILCGIRL